MKNSTEYTQLGLNERGQIELLTKLNYQPASIARLINRPPSTITRELARNRVDGSYQARVAQKLALRRHTSRTRLLDQDPDLALELVEEMEDHRSLTQALMILRRRDPNRILPGVETVYQWIYQGESPFIKRAREAMIRPRMYRSRPVRRNKQDKFSGMVMIDERPFEPEDRDGFGHWEGDLVIGSQGQQVLVTLVERKTRFSIVLKVPYRNAGTLLSALRQLVRSWPPGVFESITWDQGSEMGDHALLSEQTGVPVFFCKPHAPWERGMNENTNGVLRRKCPKGKSLSGVDEARAREIGEWLNTRPMKVLSWLIPKEVFQRELEDLHLI